MHLTTARCLILLLAVAAMATGCAGRRTPPSAVSPVDSVPAAPPAPAVDIAALIAHGCFSCLQRALAAARDQDDMPLAFEAAVLLTLRAKELGLPHDEWMAQARALAAEDGGLRLIVEMADAVPLDVLAGNRDATLSQTPRRIRADQRLAEWLAALKSAPGSPALRTYVHLALECASDAVRKPDEIAADVADAVRNLPIVQYRLGACNNEHSVVLRTLRAADPEFVDADFALARYAVLLRPYPDLDEAVRLLQSASAAFPQSPAIATTAGDVYQLIDAWTEAQAAYDSALALVPNHPDAMIGRTVSLSHLRQHEPAIAAATRLIEGSRWFLGQAFYWRAWNQFQLASYPEARADADRARKLLISPAVYVLSGLIDWRLMRRESAEHEFEEALKMDFGQCLAALFLGHVRAERSRPPEAIAAFQQAIQCFDLNISVRRAALTRLETGDAPPAHKAREIGRHQTAIEDAEKRRAEAQNGVELLQKYLTSTQSPPRSPRR
jgi:tetratricopeptide (TPR) repeat protein